MSLLIVKLMTPLMYLKNPMMYPNMPLMYPNTHNHLMYPTTPLMKPKMPLCIPHGPMAWHGVCNQVFEVTLVKSRGSSD